VGLAPLPLFKKGSGPHVNNIELGKRGRWRSNIWTYPGAYSLGSDARRGLRDHPLISRSRIFFNTIDSKAPLGRKTNSTGGRSSSDVERIVAFPLCEMSRV
jgi:hypothetical protein